MMCTQPDKYGPQLITPVKSLAVYRKSLAVYRKSGNFHVKKNLCNKFRVDKFSLFVLICDFF